MRYAREIRWTNAPTAGTKRRNITRIFNEKRIHISADQNGINEQVDAKARVIQSESG